MTRETGDGQAYAPNSASLGHMCGDPVSDGVQGSLAGSCDADRAIFTSRASTFPNFLSSHPSEPCHAYTMRPVRT